MPTKHLARYRLPQITGGGWSHPYGHGPFSPVLYADGGDAGDSGSSTTDDGTVGDGAGDTGQQGAAGDTGAAQQQATGNEDLAATVKRLERELHTARSEAGKARNAAKQQAADDAVADLTKKLGQALGLVKDDTPPDPAALAKAIQEKDAALTERESKLRARDVELAVWARADKAGARAAALLDSRAFVRVVRDLDPSDAGFTEALDKAIKTAVKDNPAYAVQSAGASGPDLRGGTREVASTKRSGSLSEAIRNTYGT
ncbi:hypothetical protein [Streptomyces sp. NPDC051577]|uniref:hypothetical protein n=1 Tax=Streptomyces sp. NPDC051577 TaxID=3155166 RepID=UPI00342CA20E